MKLKLCSLSSMSYQYFSHIFLYKYVSSSHEPCLKTKTYRLCCICSLTLKQKLFHFEMPKIFVVALRKTALVVVLYCTNKGERWSVMRWQYRTEIPEEKQKVYAWSLNTSFQMENKTQKAIGKLLHIYLSCHISKLLYIHFHKQYLWHKCSQLLQWLSVEAVSCHVLRENMQIFFQVISSLKSNLTPFHKDTWTSFLTFTQVCFSSNTNCSRIDSNSSMKYVGNSDLFEGIYLYVRSQEATYP